MGHIRIEWIRERVGKGEFYISKHGDQERQNDNLTMAELEEAIQSGIVIEQYKDEGRGESCLVAGFTRRGETHPYRLRKKRGVACGYNCLYPRPPKIQDALPEM